MLTISNRSKWIQQLFVIVFKDEVIRGPISWCLSIETYGFPSSWFPVVPKHQLQINCFTLLHLLFQLILWKKCQYAQKKMQKNPHFLQIKQKNIIPLTEVGSGPAPGNHLLVFQFHPEIENVKCAVIPVTIDHILRTTCRL